MKVTHCNGLFLLATPQGEVMPLCEGEVADTSMSSWSTLAELTPLECENDLPKDLVERCLTQHLASHVPLGWVDGVLRPLPMVVHKSAHKEQGSRMRGIRDEDEEVH